MDALLLIATWWRRRVPKDGYPELTVMALPLHASVIIPVEYISSRDSDIDQVPRPPKHGEVALSQFQAQTIDFRLLPGLPAARSYLLMVLLREKR